jgi:hypothetical protein
VDLTFDLSVAPRLLKTRDDCGVITSYSHYKALELPDPGGLGGF